MIYLIANYFFRFLHELTLISAMQSNVLGVLRCWSVNVLKFKILFTVALTYINTPTHQHFNTKLDA
jgi:hypothetical protein